MQCFTSDEIVTMTSEWSYSHPDSQGRLSRMSAREIEFPSPPASSSSLAAKEEERDSGREEGRKYSWHCL